MANSKYTTRKEATTDIIRLTTEVAKHVEALRGRIKLGRGARKSNKRAKTSPSRQHLIETPPETAIDTTPRCAPRRRRGGEETMKPSTADAHTQKTRLCASAEGPRHPHRRRRHLRPGEDGSAGRVLPSTTRPTETNHQTEHSGNKRQSPLTPKAQRRAYEKHKDQQEARRRPTRLRAPATSPENLLQRHDFSFAFYEPYLELFCLLHNCGLCQ